MLKEFDTQTFEIKPGLSGTGAAIIGLDLSKPLDGTTFKRISDAFNEYSVLVYRDQHKPADTQRRRQPSNAQNLARKDPRD
jgi:taurine dioxygenase